MDEPQFQVTLDSGEMHTLLHALSAEGAAWDGQRGITEHQRDACVLRGRLYKIAAEHVDLEMIGRAKQARDDLAEERRLEREKAIPEPLVLVLPDGWED